MVRTVKTMTCDLRMMLLLAASWSALIAAVHGYDKYADALSKYKKWEEKFEKLGSVRNERNTVFDNVVRREDVSPNGFVPHRPNVNGGRQFGIGQSSSGFGVQDPIFGGLSGPAVFRGSRNSNSGLSNNIQLGVGFSDYINSRGTPLYKIKKRYPHGYYGRKKRSLSEPVRRSAEGGWQLLDPNTGRPLSPADNEAAAVSDLTLDPIFSELATPDHLRDSRKSVKHSLDEGEDDADSYVSPDGTPLYKIKNRNPHGYYGRKRRSTPEVGRARQTRQAPGGWVILDPKTGRPVQSAVPDFYSPVQDRKVRQPLNVNSAAQPIPNSYYKHFKRYPYSG